MTAPGWVDPSNPGVKAREQKSDPSRAIRSPCTPSDLGAEGEAPRPNEIRDRARRLVGIGVLGYVEHEEGRDVEVRRRRESHDRKMA